MIMHNNVTAKSILKQLPRRIRCDMLSYACIVNLVIFEQPNAASLPLVIIVYGHPRGAVYLGYALCLWTGLLLRHMFLHFM